ncbi:hypothetical protein [Kitasatospora phosalacinea]|uniref:Uncharacterized protein n=1 Tax=Kitasatospora phosalacinea TaxID=2065 RepID=A0ABW6GTJ6_9ACTN
MTTTLPTPRRPAATVAPTSLHGLLRTLRRLTHHHHDPLLRYALPGTLAALLPLLWFRPTHPILTPSTPGGAAQ